MVPPWSTGAEATPPTGAPSPLAPVPGRRRRSAPKVVALILTACLLAAAAGLGYVALQIRSIKRVAVFGIHPVGPSSAQTILLTGSDSRAGESPAQAQHFGGASQVSGQRSDVIVLIRLAPATGYAAMLSVPRDMFVPIAGTSSSNRINVAFSESPSELVATIEQDFGIVVNHYAQEDFSGLQAITDAVGGVCMDFPDPARDGSPTGTGNESGLNIPIAGRHVLNGAMALSLVRSRYYQYFVNGAWRPEGTGDLGRIQRQHSFMRALASKAIHSSLGDPFTGRAVLSKAVHDVKIDTTFTTFGLIRLGLHLRSVHPAGIPSFTLPATPASNYHGYGDVLLPDQRADAAVIAAWMQAAASPVTTPTATVAPSRITVRVLNGSGVAGQAAAAADRLRSAGFIVAGDATAPAPQRGASVVTYAPSLAGAARTVAAHLGGAVVLRADSRAGPTLTVTTGTSFTGVTSATPAPGTPSGGGATVPAPDPPWDPVPC